jgi:hypothetical protein
VALVSGTVVDANGHAVAGARVYFVRAPVPVPDIAQVTGADGAFALAAPAPGNYRLGVSAGGRPASETEVEITGQDVSVTITLGRQT